MTDRAELEALIGRLEKLDGPDREMDFAIHRVDMGKWLDANGYVRDGDGYRTERPPLAGAERCCGPECYTASIDAAVALVERVLPGYAIAIIDNFKDGLPAGFIAHSAGAAIDLLKAHHSVGQTRPVALVTALLRALKEQGETQ